MEEPSDDVTAVRSARACRRVCLVIGQLGLGGTEKQVVLLADGLRRNGLDVTVVVLAGPGPRDAELRTAGVPVVHLTQSGIRGRFAVPRSAMVLLRLVRVLRRHRPDVVHAFLFHSYVLTAPAARLARVPVVIAGRRSLDDFIRGRRVMLAAERVATALTDLLIANADAVARCVRAGEKVCAEKVAVVYNGLPPSAYSSAPPVSVDTSLPLLVCVANLLRYKGHRHLLDAAALLRDRGLPCTLALVGEGPERVAIRERAAALGIDVRLLGSRTDVAGLLAAADVVVLPSFTEGLSNAVMEAMAAGRPIVATAVGGTPELLADGRGLLVAPADPTGLATAIAALLRDPARAALMGARARQWSRLHLDVDTMVQRHLAIYEDQLAARCAA